MHGEDANMSDSVMSSGDVRLLTGRQAAEALAVSLRTLRTLVQRGELTAVRFGRSVRFDAGDLRRWVEMRKRGVADD
jgi:excisionase family DNA binding protein